MNATRTQGKSLIASWSLLGLTLVALAAATPFLLAGAAGTRTDWTQLSGVSQAYAAISVPFSGIALAGVAATLAYQARQVHNDREDAQLPARTASKGCLRTVSCCLLPAAEGRSADSPARR